jgi:hypothetical protein
MLYMIYLRLIAIYIRLTPSIIIFSLNFFLIFLEFNRLSKMQNPFIGHSTLNNKI